MTDPRQARWSDTQTNIPPTHTLMQTQRDYSKHQLTCVWNGRLRECHSGLLKRLFASFQRLELNNSDRNQPIILVILIYAKLPLTWDKHLY